MTSFKKSHDSPPLPHPERPLSVSSSSSSSSLVDPLAVSPKLRLLIVATGPRATSWAHVLIVRLSKNHNVEMRAVVDDVVPRMTQTIIAMQNRSLAGGRPEDASYRSQAYELARWADLVVCVPLDADSIAKMLAGIADSFIQEILRVWSPQKSIILVPGMSEHLWPHSSTACDVRNLSKERNWIQVIEPILWRYEGGPNAKPVPSWNSFHQVLRIIQNRVDLSSLGRGFTVTRANTSLHHGDKPGCRRLPPEIWALIVELAEDWELAQAFGLPTTLPVPRAWKLLPSEEADALRVYEHELEWAVLVSSPSAVCRKLSEAPAEYSQLSGLLVRLLFRFAHVSVFEHLASTRPDLLAALDGAAIPTKASSAFPRVELLRFWRRPTGWFRDRWLYDAQAVDAASKYGHVDVLDWWWRQSGLPMRYTEAALEQASANGHTAVLRWWRDAAAATDGSSLVLRPGRALLWATRRGQVEVLRWWQRASGIPVT